MTTAPKGVQAMTDILAANPKLDAFVIEGGWPLFGAPQPYRQLTKPVQGRRSPASDFVIVAADTIGEEVALAKEGLRRQRSSASGRSRWATRRRA